MSRTSRRHAAVWSENLLLGIALAICCAHTGCGGGAFFARPGVSAPKIDKLQIDQKNSVLALGQSLQLSLSAVYSDGTSKNETGAAKWSSGNPSILEINSAGLAKAVGVGSTSISATLSGVTASATVEVTAAVPLSISISPNPLSLLKGEAKQMTVSAALSDGTSKDETGAAKWSSGNASILEINSVGLAKGVGVGSTSISATLTGLTASATVEVTAAVPLSISISPNPLSLASGETRQLTASATLSDGTSKDETGVANWSSGNTSILEISAAGLAKAVGKGSTSISAVSAGLTASAAVEVTAAVPLKISISPVSLSLAKGETRQLTLNAALSDGTSKDETGAAKWKSSNASILEINSAGLATAMGVGSTSISATLSGLTASAGADVTAAVPLSISISPIPFSLPKGETRQITVSAALSDGTSKDETSAAKWSSGNTSILEINSVGLAEAIGVGSTSISATLSGLTASAAAEVTAAAPLSISISPNPIHLGAGSSLPLKAISTFSDGQMSDVTSSSVWTVDDASIVEVDQHGTALGFHAGTAQIKAESLGMVAQVTAVVQPVVFTSYFSADPGAPDAVLRISAGGDGHAHSCSMVYVFNEDQQLTECCGCTVSNGGLRTLSLNQDLRSNPLTQVSPDSGSVVVIAADQGANSACDPAAISGAKAGIGWFTHMQTSGPSVYATETNLSGSETTNEFLDGVQAQCSFVKQLGSGRGICSCGAGD